MTPKSVLKSRAFLDLSRSFGEQHGHAVRPDFLIELRCALWVSPPSITAFGLPAL